LQHNDPVSFDIATNEHMQAKGVVAAGHEKTASVAESILNEGGNAFDAIVGAHFAACVAEPVLCSLGGGGFLQAQTADGDVVVYDFFAQTPKHKKPARAIDFLPIAADFGTAQQEFHIGLGAIATPGCVRGLFAVHRDLCSMPMRRLVEPAIALARDGVILNALQAYIFNVVKAIYSATPEARCIFGDAEHEGTLLGEGSRLLQPEQADTIEALAREGEALFYEGEIAQQIVKTCSQGGGHLGASDLRDYRVIKRKPLALQYRGATIFTNPPPSSGGILIAFALKLLENLDLSGYRFGSAAHLELLAGAMALTNKARLDAHLEEAVHPNEARLLDPTYIAMYREQILGRAQSLRGTTQISVMDSQGNTASMTISNGEGCGYIVPGTGVMLNNMLGEEDLNPHGFHCWQVNQRLTSMMSPSVILLPDGRRIGLGSGGSNRIRTAILQVLLNLIDFGMPLDSAVGCPRIHFEDGVLNVEGGFDPEEVRKLVEHYADHSVWEARNLFFGGTHAVMQEGANLAGVGDPRRGGVAVIAP
jgi:gamma-glutamyltranspeptidase/glutathione hydrolase